jgi:DNA-binding HxlR family transcriptional regulator
MKKSRSDCPISCSLDIFGDKWSLLIIRDVMLREKMSYSEFLASEEKIASNVLVSRLNTLEAEKILIKEVSPDNKSKFLYRLSQKGIDLAPIIVELMDWGAKYNAQCPRKDLGKKIQKDKPAAIKELDQALRAKYK